MENIKNIRNKKIISILFTITLIITVIFMVLFPLAKSVSFYEYIFDKYGTSSYTGYSSGELTRIAQHIIRFLFTSWDSFYFEINGKIVFSNQAIYHMEDVKALLQGLQIALFVIFIIFICLAIYIYIKRKDYKDILFKYSLRTILVVIAIFAIIGIVAVIDFTFVFRVFHRIIFPNPQKFEDSFFGSNSHYTEIPGVDNMMLVKILSNGFFIEFAVLEIAIVLSILGLYLLGIYLYKKKAKRLGD
jgi:uncharacterized membrane protein